MLNKIILLQIDILTLKSSLQSEMGDFLLAPAGACWSFTVWNDACAAFTFTNENVKLLCAR